MCTVKLRHKDKTNRCRLFVVPEDGPTLSGMPDIELLDILKIISDVVEGQHADRKLESQVIELSSAYSCKNITDLDSSSDNVETFILIQTCHIISGPAWTGK